MRINDNALMVVLGFVLILVGVASLLNYRLFPTNDIMVYGVWALAAIILIVVFMGKVKENTGLIFFAVWLALMGAISKFSLTFTYSDTLLAILPIASGVFLLFGL